MQGDANSGTPEKIVVEDKNQKGVKFENITVDTTVKLEKIQEEGLNSSCCRSA